MSTCILNGRTPYEAWSGKKPDLEDIKVFDCTAFMKIPMMHFKKLDDRIKQAVYLGREPGSKGNRLYDSRRGYVHVNRDVVFQENNFGYGNKREIVICQFLDTSL